MRRQGARRNACARRRRACSPASAPRGPPSPPSRSRRPRAWGVLTSPRQRRGRAGGRWASDSGSGREMSPSARCFLFCLLLDSASLSPHLRLPVHVTLCSLLFPPPPSFLPVSSPFYSVGSSLSSRTTVLVKEGQQEGIFPESVGSELELGVWPLPDWGHRWGLSPVSSPPVPSVLPVKILYPLMLRSRN